MKDIEIVAELLARSSDQTAEMERAVRKAGWIPVVEFRATYPHRHLSVEDGSWIDVSTGSGHRIVGTLGQAYLLSILR